MRRPSDSTPALILAVLLAISTVSVASPPAGTRIVTAAPERPSALAILARDLASADPDRQWEFATIVLDVLLEEYETELRTSMHETASTPARRAKLSRWRRATRELTAQLEAALLKLAEGAELSLHVDQRNQILLIIDGQVVVASGLRGMNDDAISRSVLARYCAYNACDMLPEEPVQEQVAPPAGTGTWVLRQLMRPSFELDNGLACEFASLGDRERKARACVQLATELQQIEDALRQAIAQGYPVDWTVLLASPPVNSAPYIVINKRGDHVKQQLQLLYEIDQEEWQDMLGWVSHGLKDNTRSMLILDSDRFLSD